MADDSVFQRIRRRRGDLPQVSPLLYFEVLLRRALKELETMAYTVERAGNQSIAVFDTQNVVELLSRPGVLEYLASMLASFTRTESYVMPVRVRRGNRRRVRYSDMDIDSLIRLCADADESDRLRFYKRIADVCLFVSGLVPDHALGRLAAARPRSSLALRTRRSLEGYEREGRRFYGLTEKHPAARALELSDVFGLLREYFVAARKPLVFIASPVPSLPPASALWCRRTVAAGVDGVRRLAHGALVQGAIGTGLAKRDGGREREQSAEGLGCGRCLVPEVPRAIEQGARRSQDPPRCRARSSRYPR